MHNKDYVIIILMAVKLVIIIFSFYLINCFRQDEKTKRYVELVRKYSVIIDTFYSRPDVFFFLFFFLDLRN